MRPADEIASCIVERLLEVQKTNGRSLVAIAGPPGSGKSTVAALVCGMLDTAGRRTGLLAMDGFHLDNAILDARGLRARKGAPDTFDLSGFAALLNRLRSREDVIAPRFSRELDVSVGSAVVIGSAVELVVVEGNYLLLEQPGWRDLHQHWCCSVFLEVPDAELRPRLEQRWAQNGFSPEDARAKIEGNDLPNAELVLRSSIRADHHF